MLRDKYGIIVQPDEAYNPMDPTTWDKVDEGDSAFSTGLNSAAGSMEDYKLMPLFIKDGKLVRHPYSDKNTGTAPHNNPAATSRDQVLAFFSGIAGKKNIDPVLIEACLNYAKGWRVNGDVLSPANKLYLYKCAGVDAPLWLKLIGYPNAAVDLLWNCFIKPNHEMNQAVVANMVYGYRWLKLLQKWHPDLYGNLTEYFSGWRKRPEIAEGLINMIKRMVARSWL
jgi:hypothetical protein